MTEPGWPDDWADRMAGKGCPMCATLGKEVLATGRAVRARFSPVKLNYFTLGNHVPHLHTHVLPRYRDDPAPGGPIEWQDVFSPDPVPDAELHAQAADLRGLLGQATRPA